MGKREVVVWSVCCLMVLYFLDVVGMNNVVCVGVFGK